MKIRIMNPQDRRARGEQWRELQRKFDESLSVLSEKEREVLLREVLDDGKQRKPE